MKHFFRKFLKKILRPFKNVLFEIINEANLESKQILIKRIKYLGVDSNFNGNKLFISHPNFLEIGRNVQIGNNAYFQSDGGILIGDNCHISRNVTIYSSDHNFNSKAIPYDDTRNYSSVIIEKNVWIGMNVSILPGVNIGEGAIIGFGATITKNVRPFEIVTSSEQRVIGKRNVELYNTLVKKGMIGGINGKLKKIMPNDNFQRDVCFIVGTGRSGSTTLARYLNLHPQIKAYHELKTDLIYLSTKYAHKEITREEVKKRLITLYSNLSFPDCTIYCESDQKLSNLIEVLADIFPKSKFIWINRNANDFVNSAYSRGWFDDSEFGYSRRSDISVTSLYSSKIYSDNRINGYKCGQFDEETWKNMTPFQRNCWYWQYWNETIENQLLNLDQSRVLKTKIEKINANEIFDFLKISTLESIIKTENRAKYEKIPCFTNQQLRDIDSYCKIGMGRWYQN